MESGGECEACKHCNCKKSKCSELYYEYFAAGVYCVEPCSCQECFNSFIHEDTVLSTRRQIESRNPLAFTPNVIITAEPIAVGEESSKTPASARHRRGCNCKKSGCTKKYCECYQGGVGCSTNCRCEGCKNAFGGKGGSIGIELELEGEQNINTYGKSVVNRSLQITTVKNDAENTNFCTSCDASEVWQAIDSAVTFLQEKETTMIIFPCCWIVFGDLWKPKVLKTEPTSSQA